MEPEFDKINNFIYNKINNYNKQFDKFQKNLDIQDNKIHTVCKNKVKETIKNNPKKTAKKFINLTEINESDDTSENEYVLKKNNIKDIEKNILKKNNNHIKGGNVDIGTDTSGEIEIMEEIEEYEEKNNVNNNFINYNFMYGTFIIIIFSYICLFIVLYFLDNKISKSAKIFTPLNFLLDKYKSITNHTP